MRGQIADENKFCEEGVCVKERNMKSVIIVNLND
jgi:hypothetical protein